MVETKLKYRGDVYEYSASKDNVLTYIKQPIHHYSDWVEDGGILIVKYNANADITHRYYVLHEFRIAECNGNITQENLHEYGKLGGNRYAEIVESENN